MWNVEKHLQVIVLPHFYFICFHYKTLESTYELFWFCHLKTYYPLFCVMTAQQYHNFDSQSSKLGTTANLMVRGIFDIDFYNASSVLPISFITSSFLMLRGKLMLWFLMYQVICILLSWLYILCSNPCKLFLMS